MIVIQLFLHITFKYHLGNPHTGYSPYWLSCSP